MTTNSHNQTSSDTDSLDKTTQSTATDPTATQEGWQPKKKSPAKKILVLGLIIAGILGILYAYHLPPFSPKFIETNNAYVRGKPVQVSPKVAGYIKEILVQDYQWVEKDQVLAQIETDQFKMKVAQAKAGLISQENALGKIKQAQNSANANIAMADANIESAKATLANAQVQFDRMRKLLSADAISRQEYDNAQVALKKAQSTLKQATAQKQSALQELANVGVNKQGNIVAIDNAKTGLELAELELSYATIKAPISGQLGEIMAKQGQLVSVGTNLMSIVPPEHWLIANIKETEVASIAIGQPARIEIDALGGKQVLTGKVVQIAPATGSEFSTQKTDPSTGNFIKITQRIPVKIEFDANQPTVNQISIGMSARVQIDKIH
ncbi:HlyD family secretion protein [Moraxella oculi]|uniref:HlyD family secretion protein n=1 Tax=Moraxella oculi TaxID=2940516 RepID=A0ABW8UB06_9GAMM